MNVQDYLTVRAGAQRRDALFLLGETGMTMRVAHRPESTLTDWMEDTGIPAQANDMLAADPRFQNLMGLIRAFAEPGGSHGNHVGWVLARSTSGLVSISVRDAASCETSLLREDAQLALHQAWRYCAADAVVIVQGRASRETAPARKALARAFGLADVRDHMLYAAEGDAQARLSVGCVN
ncbi:hypothetical protein [Paraburkholderia dipogonis]|jgi:hypothetical protein|uniref:hypothetical protein n=1 Tax=Paraburkholderia dipogonis TaxID=1211383 RepID=UPI0038B7F689